MNIGFYEGTLNERGVAVAVYDYADYNEKILKNNSFIITKKNNKHKSLEKFQKRFQNIFFIEQDEDINKIIDDNNITHLYVAKFGTYDGIVKVNCRLMVHCVFDSRYPHGDKCAVIGKTINDIYNTNLPIVPHIVTLPNHDENLRKDLNIPNDMIVFGRYGGDDTFNLPFVHQVIKNIVERSKSIYFIFMNTNKFYEHDRIIYLKGTTDMYEKRKFINTTDALLHGRDRGETFGLTCGEFAICKKPVFTFEHTYEKEHMNILGDQIIKYTNPTDLMYKLCSFKKGSFNMDNNGYMNCDPMTVMQKFKTIFLD